MSTTLIVVASATPASLLGALVVLVPALRMRAKAAVELVAADAAVAKAEELVTEYERTRNLSPFWSFDAPVLHVEHPTGEIHRPTLADLAEEVALVQLTDRPADDEDEVGEEQPGERSIGAVVAWLTRPFIAVADWVRERWFMSDADRDLVWRQVEVAPEPQPLALSAADEAELRVELAQWVAANPPTNPPYIGRHWNPGTEHTGIFPAINASIPTQRTDGDL